MEPENIQDRTMRYALRAIRLVQHLNKQRDGTAWVLGKQYLRSATSVGANLAEAQAGETKADFIHKCSIAQKEARECHYWLMLMLKSELVTETKLRDLLKETNEIIAILTTILIRTKRGRA